jgi:hypothetical protein
MHIYCTVDTYLYFMKNSKLKFKCGENVKAYGFDYLFLGYVDYPCKFCKLADKFGNTHITLVSNVMVCKSSPYNCVPPAHT